MFAFLPVLGLCCFMGFSLVVVSWGYSLTAVCRLLIAVDSLWSTGSRTRKLQWLWHVGSVVLVPWALVHRHHSCGHGPSCFEAFGIFLYQGLNLCLLCWLADSLPLSHQGSPRLNYWLMDGLFSWILENSLDEIWINIWLTFVSGGFTRKRNWSPSLKIMLF